MPSKMLLGVATLGRGLFVLGWMLLAPGGTASAGVPVSATEIDAGSMTAALALLSGAVLVISNRSRRK